MDHPPAHKHEERNANRWKPYGMALLDKQEIQLNENRFMHTS